MKAQDSVKNFYPTLRMYTNFAVRGVKKICQQFGPREAGSEAELNAQRYMAEQIGDAADAVTEDTFRLSPRAFMGWLRLAGIFLLIGTAAGIANLFLARGIPYGPAATLVCCAVIVLMLLFEFLFYKPFTDSFYPKAESHNIWCVRKAGGETKRRIILAGHADSSVEWRPTYVGGAKFLYFTFVYPLLGLIYQIAISVLGLIKGENDVLIWIGCAFIPGYFMLIFFMNDKLVVDGANDNLTGCMTAAGVMKFLGDNRIRFENTEVAVLLTGAEEAGLRGAKAAVKSHPELCDPNVETVFIALDTIRDYDDMAIYHRDMTGTVKQSPAACALVEAAGKASGLSLQRNVLFAGATDAAAMTQGGVAAVGFCAMNPGPPRYYHTRLDKADILQPKTVEKALELAVQAVFIFDEQGLKESYSVEAPAPAEA